MNINRELKVIWWAPERCATKVTAEIFKKMGFEVYDSISLNFKPLSESYHSHKIIKPEEFSDYKVICSIRNPYDRILSFYLNFTSVGKNFVYTKNKKNVLKSKMDVFCLELFQYAIYDRTLVNLEREIPLREYAKNLNFNGVIPDSFIKMENLRDDLEKIDFVRESEWWKNGWIEEFLENNQYKENRPINFYEIYSSEAANRVFNYFRKHFYLCDYDPFSFTSETISEDEKFNFIHEIF